MGRILMVDAEQDGCRLMQRILSSLGHDVQAFTEAHAAVEWLRTHAADLVVLDIELRRANAITVLEFLKGRHPHTRVILITGTPAAETTGRALELGIDDCLVKPFEIAEVEERVKRALAPNRADLSGDDEESRSRDAH